jgi:hypothetical protein
MESLKYAAAVFLFSILLFVWPNHKSAALSVGLGSVLSFLNGFPLGSQFDGCLL